MEIRTSIPYNYSISTVDIPNDELAHLYKKYPPKSPSKAPGRARPHKHFIGHFPSEKIASQFQLILTACAWL